jgi:TetR/AcrR family fatty acid metabolism transcriptional regulator
MARPRTDDKRERILKAAVGVFARKGYFGSRVSEIAKKAGVADGTIYLYFRNKEDILVSLFDDLMAEHVEKVKRALPSVPDAESRLRLVAEHHLRERLEFPSAGPAVAWIARSPTGQPDRA